MGTVTAVNCRSLQIQKRVEGYDKKLNIELEYMEDYLPTPRHRKLRQREASEPYSITVKETSSEKAPVVLRTHDIKRYCDGVQATDYRQYNGQLYTSLRRCDMMHTEDMKKANEPFPADELVHYVRNHGRVSREEAVKQIREYVNRFLLIDGVLWERAGEPMYQVCVFGLGHNHGGTALMITNHYNSNCRWTDYFTALQHDAAIEAAVRTAISRGDTQSVERIRDKGFYIEVLDPAAVRADPKAWGGKGDRFINTLNTITANASSSMEAGLLALTFMNGGLHKGTEKSLLDDHIKSAEDRASNNMSKVKEHPDERER